MCISAQCFGGRAVATVHSESCLLISTTWRGHIRCSESELPADRLNACCLAHPPPCTPRHQQSQIVVMKKGIWMSQRAARKIGVNETLQEGLNGFGNSHTDRPHPDTW